MIQIVRVVILLTGLLLTVFGALAALQGVGVAIPEMEIAIGPISLKGMGLAGGSIVAVIGLMLVFVAASQLKRHTKTNPDGSSEVLENRRR